MSPRFTRRTPPRWPSSTSPRRPRDLVLRRVGWGLRGRRQVGRACAGSGATSRRGPRNPPISARYRWLRRGSTGSAHTFAVWIGLGGAERRGPARREGRGLSTRSRARTALRSAPPAAGGPPRMPGPANRGDTFPPSGGTCSGRQPRGPENGSLSHRTAVRAGGNRRSGHVCSIESATREHGSRPFSARLRRRLLLSQQVGERALAGQELGLCLLAGLLLLFGQRRILAFVH